MVRVAFAVAKRCRCLSSVSLAPLERLIRLMVFAPLLYSVMMVFWDFSSQLLILAVRISRATEPIFTTVVTNLKFRLIISATTTERWRALFSAP
jgi:hypothetical protein